MKKIEIKAQLSGRNRDILVGVFDSFRDLIDYNKSRVPLCSSYTTSILRETYNATTIRSRANDISWYGTKDPNLVLTDIWDFIDAQNLNTKLSSLASRTSDITTAGFNRRKKMYLNSIFRGVFSFDLASSYLYPKKVFYSEFFKSEVNEEAVESVGIEPNLKFFYTRDPKHEVTQKNVYDSEGNQLFSSTFENAKVYIDLPKPPSEKFTVDLFIAINFLSNVTAQEIVWNALAVNAIAQTFSDSSIEFRIWGISTIQGSGRVITEIIRIKDFQEAVDTNSIALICGDPRIYRIHFFRNRAYLCDDFGFPREIESGYGASIHNNDFKKDIMFKTFEALELFDDEFNKKIYPDNKIFVNTCLSEQEAIDEYKRVIEHFEVYSSYQREGGGADFAKYERFYNYRKRGALPSDENDFTTYLRKHP